MLVLFNGFLLFGIDRLTQGCGCGDWATFGATERQKIIVAIARNTGLIILCTLYQLGYKIQQKTNSALEEAI